MDHLFIQILFEPNGPFRFLSWVFVVIVSIVLHELAHGWAAISCGDDTPIVQDRMTGNPLVHMGPFSLLALAMVGIAWGQMPINHDRLRGKYAEALVAAAGPAMNLLLGAMCIVALGLLLRFGPPTDEGWLNNLRQLLWTGGAANALLLLFNLMPVPPLDGSHVLANFSRPYAQFIGDPSKQGVLMMGFIGSVVVLNMVMSPVLGVVADLVRLIA